MYFYFFEFDDLTRKERLLSSLFQAVTPRTAGFNTVELTDLSEAGQFITIALMFRKNHSRLHRTGWRTCNLWNIYTGRMVRKNNRSVGYTKKIWHQYYGAENKWYYEFENKFRYAVVKGQYHACSWGDETYSKMFSYLIFERSWWYERLCFTYSCIGSIYLWIFSYGKAG